jgi:hypothetical protein
VAPALPESTVEGHPNEAPGGRPATSWSRRSRARCAAVRPGWALAVAVVAGFTQGSPLHARQVAEICPAGRIGSITIENSSVFDEDAAAGESRLAPLYRLANTLHVQTQPEVVERELLFAVGDCYDVEQLRDTERLLRQFGFLADANVYGIRQPDGTVRVVVDTQDEWSARVEPVVSAGSGGLSGLRLVEDNLVGTGRRLALFYEREAEERVFGAAYATPQFFRTRWNMGLSVAKTEVGYSYGQAVTYPFVAEVGRRAFRQSIQRDERFFELLVPRGGDLVTLLVPLSLERMEVAAAMRWGGERYRQSLLGGSLSSESVSFPQPARFAREGLHHPAGAPPEDLEWAPFSSVRLTALVGQRSIFFVQRRALDTVEGTEDVQLGLEAEVALGPTIPWLSEDQDVALGLGLLAAGEAGGRLLVGATFTFEARRASGGGEGVPEWNDVLTELDTWGYYRSSPEARQTLVASLSGVGGWHPRTPFQLTLGGGAGLRGHPRHMEPGGRRINGSLEHRASLGWPLPDLFDLGSVVFVDAGRIWAADVPFGQDSPLRASAGFGIRAAFPPGSRQTFRADVGWPLVRGAGARDAVLSVGVGQAIGRVASRRDPQLVRSTRYGLRRTDFLLNGRRP